MIICDPDDEMPPMLQLEVDEVWPTADDTVMVLPDNRRCADTFVGTTRNGKPIPSGVGPVIVLLPDDRTCLLEDITADEMAVIKRDHSDRRRGAV
jgi:hypothetical protein